MIYLINHNIISINHTTKIFFIVVTIYFTFIGVVSGGGDNAANANIPSSNDSDITYLKSSSSSSSLRRILQSSTDNNINNTYRDNDLQALADHIKLTKNVSNSIYHYSKKYCSIVCHEFMILLWDKDGNLDQYSLKDGNHDWWNSNNKYDKTLPSDYGRIALLFNFDVIKFYTNNWEEPWNIIPPVPILSWTIPDQYHDHKYHFVLPTPYDRNGFSRWLNMLAANAMTTSNTTYYDRKNTIIWRGAIHGSDRNRLILTEMSSKDNNNIWLDAKDTSSSENSYMSMEDMASKYKYQLDIGGESGTSWGGLRWKMCTGNLVFKVNSWSRDWWHDMIKPYKHYIPVKDDLSDLYTLYQWVEDHPLEVDKIRARGMKRCQDTIQESFIQKYEYRLLKRLPSIIDKELLNEVQLLRDGYFDLLINQKSASWQ